MDPRQPSAPSFRKRFLPSYLFRLWISSLLFASTTLCYALFGSGGLPPLQALGLFTLTAAATALLSCIAGLLAFRGLERAVLSGDEGWIGAYLRGLPRSTAAIPAVLGLAYIALISAMERRSLEMEVSRSFLGKPASTVV